MFQQQKQLLEKERKNFAEAMASISTSFLQGTQAIFTQFLNRPMQPLGQPGGLFQAAAYSSSKAPQRLINIAAYLGNAPAGPTNGSEPGGS